MSIRPVTAYPPTTLAAAKNEATNASTYPTTVCEVTPISSAPTSTIPWIELAADISGVCRVAGTLPMTSMPMSSASTKIVRSVTRAVDKAGSLVLEAVAQQLRHRGLDDLAVAGDDDPGLDLVGRVDL